MDNSYLRDNLVIGTDLLLEMSSDYSEPIIPDDAELDDDVSQGSTKRIRKLTSKVFIPDYNVYSLNCKDLADMRHPNRAKMKFLMNSCLLLATADGSTIEIIEEIGADNMVAFVLSELDIKIL
ncbi:hypothetical protein LOK49_LG01G00471 [Camellia lanceoleosa]|uniref:Uncharacterized protein n=1 Tax=Camellia lanceoleosa TaxID=1840588 RepID=A0ACC0J5G9_9ERIC|nr:hypothetical protein LOK49_LG01G00471 [Camellia lanceoleosa]